MRFEIWAPVNGKLVVALTNLSRSSAEELVCSFGHNAVVRVAQG